MTYYKVKQGLFWTYDDSGIYNYYTNENLKNHITTSDNHKIFNLLTTLKNPHTLEQLLNMKIFDNNEDLIHSLEFLEVNNYIDTLNSITEINKFEKRLDNFIGAVPGTSYQDYKFKSKNIKTCLIGTGTAGSYIPEVYLKMGLSNLTMIDYDKVEEHNIVAQNFSINDIDKFKLDVLIERYKEEFPDKIISGVKKEIQSFDHLNTLVNIEDFNYILMYADDYDLTIDILSNIFKHNKEIKVILSGYRVFSVESILVNYENVDTILTGLIKDLKQYNSLKGVIVDNSGTILESYLIAFSTMKMILDDLLGLNKTDYMMSDLLVNSYFIGSQFEYMYDNTRVSLLKENLYNFNEGPSEINEKNWLNPITLKNLKENNMIQPPELDSKMSNFVIFNNFDYNQLKLFMDYKGKLGNKPPEYLIDLGIHKEQLLKNVLNYVKEFYPEKYYNHLKNLISYGYIYTYKNKFGSQSPQAIQAGNHVYIYCELDETLHSFNNLLHEIFHSLFFLNDNFDVYEHEEFVLKEQINFYQFFEKNAFVAKLRESFMFWNTHMYLTNKITLDYEKYTINDKLSDFFDKWSDVEEEELILFINQNIDIQQPLSNYKYVYAMEKNLVSFMELFDNKVLNIG